MTPYALIRSKRKTVALYIRGGALQVRAPLKMPESDINRFVASKEKWIIDKLTQAQQQKAQRDSFKTDYGSMLLYRGNLLPILACDGYDAEQKESIFAIASGLSPEQIKTACIRIYRQSAKRVFTDKALTLAQTLNVTPRQIKINSAGTRWGSCSATGNLNFSWRLIMATDHVIDYVVIHELAHLKEMNHSKRFWAVVESVLPDYRERRKKLSELQNRLSQENWD